MSQRKMNIIIAPSNPILKIHKFIFLAEKLLDRELRKDSAISFSQFRMISVIAHTPGISQKKIALVQETTEAAVSRHIEVLQRMQYVALTTNSNNRKEHNLHLTKIGKSLHDKTTSFVEVRIGSILETLEEQKRAELSEIFDILVDAVRRECEGQDDCEI